LIFPTAQIDISDKLADYRKSSITPSQQTASGVGERTLVNNQSRLLDRSVCIQTQQAYF